ncbi:MAG: ferritin family protein [Nitrospirae bacterium]|nr:ferritin family protein [Nitrospirota bacterium]
MPVSEAVEKAIKMETDAMKFYREAAQKTSHPFGRKMFESLVRDEARHLRLLEEILKGLDIDPHVQCLGDVRTVFSDLKDQMLSRVTASSDELEAIRLALEMETQGYKYYQEAAQKAEDPKEKRLFEVLTKEEERHYQILNNTYSFLEDTGNWFMWEELSIVEG